MRKVLLLCSVATLLGCYKSEDRAGGQAAATPTLSLADVAGKWTVQSLAENSDSVIVTYELTATTTTEGWTITLPGRDPIPLHVVPGGDSVVTHAGPFESVLRPGVTVSTESAMRPMAGMPAMLEGWTVAHYQGVPGPDSVLRMRMRGTRAP